MGGNGCGICSASTRRRTPARLTPGADPGHSRTPAGVAISPDGTEVAVALAGSPATVRIYSFATGRVVHAPGRRRCRARSRWSRGRHPGESSQFTAARVLRWSSDGRRLAFAWNSTAIRVLDVSAPNGNLITSSSAVGRDRDDGQQATSSVTCNASQGWQLIAGGQEVICAGSVKADGPPTSAGQRREVHIQRANVYRLPRGNQGRPARPDKLVDFEPECSAQAGNTDGAYIGWANADGSVVIGSQVWDGHVRFGLFRDGRFTRSRPLQCRCPYRAGAYRHLRLVTRSARSA